MQFRHWRSRTFSFVLALVVCLFSAPTLIRLSSAVESHYFPVVSNLKVTEVEVDIHGNPVVSGTFTRNRDCTFKNLLFFKMDGTRALDYESPIGVKLPDFPAVVVDRPPGDYNFGPWTLFTTLHEFENQSYARLIYQCHPIYDTITYVDIAEVLSNE